VVVGAGGTGGAGGGATVLGADVAGGAGGTTVVGAGDVTGGAGGGAIGGGAVWGGAVWGGAVGAAVVGAAVLGAGMVARTGGRGAVVVGEAAPFMWPAGAPLVVAAREPEVSAKARLIPPAATRAIKTKVIPFRLVTSGLSIRVVESENPHRLGAARGL
jgi:hypothetical protein